MRAANGWPRGVPALRVGVDCGGARHTVLWRRGSLVLCDHDVGADAVLVALGGRAPACLEIRRSWRLGYIEEQVPTPSAALIRSLSSVAMWMTGSGSPPMAMPEPLRRLREASVLHTWGRGLRDAGAAEQAQQAFLERSVARRLREIAEPQADRVARPGAHKQLDIAASGCGADVVATGSSDEQGLSLTLRVPLRWLTTVWMAEREVSDDGTVLAVRGAPPTEADVARWMPDRVGGWQLVVRTEPIDATPAD